MTNYLILKSYKYTLGRFSIVPIRKQDIQKIRQWRNEQIEVLRQEKFLTKKDQEKYYENIIKPSFKSESPSLILFSILDGRICIGYGGLVHINWKAKNAEISFLLDTKKNKPDTRFRKYFQNFLKLMCRVAFQELNLNKLTTETYKFRKTVIDTLENNGFENEGILKNHAKLDELYCDSILHAIFKETYLKNKNSKEQNVLITSISNKVPLILCLKKSIAKMQTNTKIFGGNINDNCVGKFFVDQFWIMPPITRLKTDELVKYCKMNKINYIIPSRDGDLYYFSKNKNYLEKNNIHVMISPYQTVNLCLDKIQFFEKGRKHGLPVIQTSNDISKIQSRRYVVKERFGAGSNRIGLNLTKKEALNYARILKNPIFQPFIRGNEYSVDVYVGKDGKPRGIITRKRTLIINGESKISEIIKNKKLENVCLQLISNFNFYGHIIIQAFIDSTNKIHLIECNCRFGGASSLSVEAGLDSLFWFFLESQGEKLDRLKFNKSYPKMKQIRYSKDMIIT